MPQPQLGIYSTTNTHTHTSFIGGRVMILSTDFYWVSVPIPNPKSTMHRLAHFTTLVDFQLPRQANIERFSTHTHAHLTMLAN